MIKNRITYLILAVGLMTASCKQAAVSKDPISFVPPIEEIAGDWVRADTIAMEPSLRNFRGQALVNRDVTSISWFASAPYSGGYHTGVMKINGQVPMVDDFLWQPWQALRKSEVDGFGVLSSTRMVAEQNGILWRVEITNKTNENKQLNIDLDLIGFISKYGGDWQWWYPFPKMNGKVTKRDDEVDAVRKFIGKEHSGQKVMIEELIEGKPTGKMVPIKLPTDQDILNCPKYKAQVENGVLFISDTETEAITAFALVNKPENLTARNSGGSASWKCELKPGETKTIEYSMAFGDNKENVSKEIADFSGNFNKWFDQTREMWETRWQKLFTPNNDLVSGCFPILETSDKKAAKVYYTSPLTMLYMMHTNLPEHKRVFLTGGPKWGASIVFFWDNTEWSILQAVTDPAMIREELLSWIKIDPNKFYGKDNFGGKGVGNGYSANYWALFQLIRSYITVTGDYDFLKETVNGKTVLETIDSYAMNWQKLSIYGKPGCTDDIYKLADFGDDEWNLLECVPTYKHIVPSFNAAYIWMMYETAKFQEKLGNLKRAAELNKLADEMFPRLMKLYAGNGVWNSLYPNNKMVEVRHCMDFMFVGKHLADKLPDPVKTEMIDFLYRELMTNYWMRAQSLQDIAAKNSDRPDHGPLGAYDGWPVGTMMSLIRMGQPAKALDFYHAIEPVTHEGTWAQAHELWGENKDNKKARVRIAERGWHARDALAGIGMAQVMLQGFFGFDPDVNGTAIGKVPAVNFEGTMHHVLYKGEYYFIELKNGQSTMVKENIRR